MKTINDAAQFLTDVGIFYLSTIEDDHPRCRPLGFKMLIGDQLYFGIGNHKDVYAQMMKNPKVEIAASKTGGWLRMYGTAIFETDDTLAQTALDKNPFLKSIYNEQTGFKLAIFHLENGSCEFRSMMKAEEVFPL